MGRLEILAELPVLKAEERSEVFRRLCELLDVDLVGGTAGNGPSAGEVRVLDEALDAYERDGEAGVPWRETLERIRGERRE